MNELTVAVEQPTTLRLDKYLCTTTGYSRTFLRKLFDEKSIFVNGKVAKGSYHPVVGDTIVLNVPEQMPLSLEAEDIPLNILYEDADIIVINKPKGMVVHPCVGNYQHTLVNALLFHCKDLSGINGVLRPGIVHRIDKNTTGCIVACKNDFAHHCIAQQLLDKTCHREYAAIVEGVIDENEGYIDAPIGRDANNRQRMCVTSSNSKEAGTYFSVNERFLNATYLHCRLTTGRTHQIRVHMKYIHHPVLGDEKYGNPCSYMDTKGQVLHAQSLTLVHPRRGETMQFQAPLPDYFEKLLSILRKEKEE